ncbi:HEAT repeat domain-containing protein [Candidatus Woesearchaeota archaeon]|nr:HEAT repeat domain-containing protein [Candidatus Woesearchaeota archaeon]
MKLKVCLLFLILSAFVPNIALSTLLVNQTVTIDVATQEYLPKQQKYKAWQYYQYLLGLKNVEGTLMPKEEGQFTNGRSYILEKMKSLVEDERVSQEINPLAEDFLKNIRETIMLHGRKETIQKAYLFLSTKYGFESFSFIGDLYLEEGAFEEAASMYEEAYRFSIGFNLLDSEQRENFSRKIDFCHSRLQEKKRTPPSNYIFSRNEETEKLIVLDENGQEKWFFKKENYRFLSEPYFTKDKLFLITSKVEEHYFNDNNLFLFVLDQKTGHLLREQYVAESGEYFKAQKGYVRPYSLIGHEGEIVLFTEDFEARFNQKGEPVLIYDYSKSGRDKSVEFLIGLLKENEIPSVFTINCALILREIFSEYLPSDESKKNLIRKIILESALRHEDATFRRRAISIIDSSSLDPEALNDSDETVQIQAALVWRPYIVGPSNLIPKEVKKIRTILFDILENGQDEILRYEAIEALTRPAFYTNLYSKEEAQNVMALFVKLLKDKNIVVRHQAMDGILEIATSAIGGGGSGGYQRTFEDSAKFISPFVPQLHEALYDESDYMRRNAAILVGIIANRGTATKEDLEKS